MRPALLIALALSGLFLAGCGETAETNPPGASAVANKECPIMGHAVDPELPTAEWNGKTIGFCCEAGGCKEKFLAMSDEEKTKVLEGKLK